MATTTATSTTTSMPPQTEEKNQCVELMMTTFNYYRQLQLAVENNDSPNVNSAEQISQQTLFESMFESMFESLCNFIQ